MTGERQVRLRSGTRTVSVPAANGPELVRYAGVTVLRIEDGDLAGQTWIPVGAAPSYADDEALIAAWHAALRWSRAHTDV